MPSNPSFFNSQNDCQIILSCYSKVSQNLLNHTSIKKINSILTSIFEWWMMPFFALGTFNRSCHFMTVFFLSVQLATTNAVVRAPLQSGMQFFVTLSKQFLDYYCQALGFMPFGLGNWYSNLAAVEFVKFVYRSPLLTLSSWTAAQSGGLELQLSLEIWWLRWLSCLLCKFILHALSRISGSLKPML